MTSQNEVTDFSDQFQGRTAYLSVHDGTADSNDFANSFFRSNPLNTTQIGDVAGNLLAPNEECTWTVRVWEDYFGDEVDWELRDSDGTVILFGGGYGNGYDDIQDRKSTRLNSSHVAISYAVFCLKKKRK